MTIIGRPRNVVGMTLSLLVSAIPIAIFLVVSFFNVASVPAAEVRMIYPELEPEIGGKEVDWIYGDYLMKNDLISLTIAAPIRTRDANLTVRNVGAAILDLTLNAPSNDQLSAYIPAGGRYQFHDPSLVEIGKTERAVYWQCKSSKSLTGDGSVATVRYSLADGMPFVDVTVQIESDTADRMTAFDGVRADNTFKTDLLGDVAHCSDAYFRQSIGFKSPASGEALSWKKARPLQLHYGAEQVVRTGQTLSWALQLYPATSQIDLKHATRDSGDVPAMQTFRFAADAEVRDDFSFVKRGEVEIVEQGGSG